MNENALQQAHFESYWQLLHYLLPATRSLMIFSGDGHFIWFSDDGLPKMMERVSLEVAGLHRQIAEGGEARSSCYLGQGLLVELIALDDGQGQQLTLALMCHVDQPCLPDQEQEALELINRSLLREQALIQQLVDKELELNEIADELVHRYEELNLIYASYDPAHNPTHGRELLQKIVANATSFLDVDIALILMPEKDFTIVHQNHGVTDLRSRKLLKLLGGDLYGLLQQRRQSLVINGSHDASKLGLSGDFQHKMILSPLVNFENEVIGLIATINRPRHPDFTNSDRNLLEVLANKAASVMLYNFDPLTGLENSHSFELIVCETLKQTWKTAQQHAIVNIDIDRMAVINDIGGLDVGDRVIKAVATIVKNQLRAQDTVARLGGDKFGILLRNCPLDQAREVVDKIAQAVHEIDLNLGREVHEVSISAGIAPITADLQNVSSVLSNAESARLTAKEHGRGQIQVFELDDKDLLRRKEQIKWVSRTQAALREDRFELFAQRIQRIGETGPSQHYEILLRMRDEDGQLAPPGLFLPAAENFFLMPRLDRWVIDKALALLEEHHRAGQSGCELSINLSGQSMTDPKLADDIAERIRHYGVEPTRLCFEVTETAAIANIEEAQLFIRRIRELGCRFSLDDFGTGQSSFAYLKNLDVDYLKIDGSFVRNISDDAISLSMVSAIHHVARAMDLQTIAEYVENDEILHCLQEIGIEYAQGYGIHAPQPFIELLGHCCCT